MYNRINGRSREDTQEKKYEKKLQKPEFIMSYFNFGNDIMLSSATPETLFTKGVRIDTIRANLNS